MTVDWTKPLVAVDTETGERVEVELVSGPDFEGDYKTKPTVFDCRSLWLPDGKNWSNRDRYRIENRDQEPPVSALKEACERAGLDYSKYSDGFYITYIRNSIRAHALTIAKYENEPEDPVLAALLDGASEAYEEFGRVWPGTVIIAKRQMAKLQERGIELAKAGDA